MARTADALAAAMALVVMAASPRAAATSEALFGFGPRSTSLAASDIADSDPVVSAAGNPAAAARSGARFQAGYGRAWPRLELSGRDAELSPIAGTDLAFQAGGEVARDLVLGFGMALHLPDQTLARISFRPGTEPVFVRYEPAAYRTSADVVAAVRYGAWSIGGGAALLVDAAGRVDFLLGQDGGGTYADGSTDVRLPYHLAPIVGVHADLGPATLGARYRGAHSVDVDLATHARVEVVGNPLNGTTSVLLSGDSGYVPATIDLAGRFEIVPSLRVLSSLQLARWSQAPSPAADLSLDVQLGLTPGQLEARFVRPGFRDTLSPRIGLELEPGPRPYAFALRGAYAYWPSPVPDHVGLTTHLDAPAHVIAAGGGLRLGRLWGVELSADAAAQLILLEERTQTKPKTVLPFSRTTTSGHLIVSSMALEASWL